MPDWRVAPEWRGETAFIMAGGPSAAGQDIAALRGRRLIAINSSWTRAPFADVLFFADDRWWREFNDAVLAGFSGRIITTATGVAHPRFLRLRKAVHEDRLSTDPATLMIRYTSLTAALNLAVHFGAARIVLLGADGKPAADGRLHHHDEYPQRLGGQIMWEQQRGDLCNAARSLSAFGILVVNASPGSALADIWPVVNLEDELQ